MNAETFRVIEESLAVKWSASKTPTGLEQWYERVRDKPLAEFSDEDLCIACRQELYLEWIVPRAISRIRINPLAGERYDGELLVALHSVPKQFWIDHAELARGLRMVINSSRIDTSFEDVAESVRSLRDRLGSQ
jgi:hypothetical protein